MEIQITFKNLDKLRVKRPEKFHIATQMALSECGQFLKTFVIGKMRETPTNNKGISFPGNYPAIQSGKLVSSLNYIISGGELKFGSNINYAVFLELGTKKMEARPFISNTFSSEEAEIRKIIINRMRQVLKDFLG